MPRPAKNRRLSAEQKQLVEDHVEVPKIVAAIMKVDLTFDEKLSAANLAMVHAAFSWRPDGGASFAHMARMAGEQAILREAKMITFRIGGPRNPTPAQIADGVNVDGLPGSFDPAAEAERRDESRRLHEIVDELWPPIAREVISDMLAGLTGAEAGRKMEISAEHANAHRRKALKILRDKL